MEKAAKKDWTLNAAAFQSLLEWLDEGTNSEGQNYIETRRRLVAYFDRKNCLNPDDLADETLNRVARRIIEAGKIDTETPAKFCYITARFVFLESLRGADKGNVSIDEVTRNPNKNQLAAPENEAEEKETKEKMLVCLEKCADQLETANREIIVSYYFGEERVRIDNRRALAQKLGISTNALTIRACRIRDKLEICVGKCAAEN